MRNYVYDTNFDRFTQYLDALISQNNKTFSNDAIIAFLGGFSGAFFAFIFGRFANLMNKKRDRYLEHKKAMVKMEYLVIKHQDKVNRLVFLLNNTIEIINNGKFTHNRFLGLNVTEDIELELADIGLINEVANYWQSVERINNDCNSLNRILETLQQVILSGTIPHKDNFAHLVEQMKSLKQYLEKLFIDENIGLNAYLRILLKKNKKQPEIKRFLKLYAVKEIKIDRTDIVRVKKQIYKEINKREKEDSARLAKAKNGIGENK